MPPSSRFPSERHLQAVISEGITGALSLANSFTEPLGVAVKEGDDESHHGDILGSYELGSVFEKTIVVNVCRDNLLKTFLALGGRPDEVFLLEEAAVTVLHEVGHGLMEMLLDYAENIEEVDGWVRSPQALPYFDVFNDDNRTEEDIVEEFGRNLWQGRPSLLSNCIQAMSRHGLI